MTAIQETPQVFALTLVVGVLASAVTLLSVVYHLIRGRRSRALTLVSRWAICVLIYLAVSVGVGLLRPTHLIAQGQNWCFDDWCIAVEAVHQTRSADRRDVTYTTDLRIYNDARSPEGVRGFWAYLRTVDDRRYAPMPGPWQQVIESRVPGHGIARTSMDFVVPVDVHPSGFVTNHGFGLPCRLLPSLLEIGQAGCLFHRSSMIRIESAIDRGL